MAQVLKDTVIIKASELDEIMLLLEASFAATGDKSAFRIIEILMKETKELKIIENKLYDTIRRSN